MFDTKQSFFHKSINCYLGISFFFLFCSPQLAKTRLKVPCRASGCAHPQCFDARAYLELNRRKPVWVCPVCDRPAPFRLLKVDGYNNCCWLLWLHTVVCAVMNQFHWVFISKTINWVKLNHGHYFECAVHTRMAVMLWKMTKCLTFGKLVFPKGAQTFHNTLLARMDPDKSVSAFEFATLICLSTLPFRPNSKSPRKTRNQSHHNLLIWY